MTFYPAVQQRNEAFRTAVNDQVPRTSDVDNQPVWNGVIEGIDCDGQIPGPRTRVDHSGNFESPDTDRSTTIMAR